MMAQISEFAANHPFLVIAFVTLLALVFFNELKIASNRHASLTPAAAVQLMNNEDVIVLDVREPAETAVGGKIGKAIQIPSSSVAQRIDELEKHKSKTLLVYDKTGARSGIACKELGKHGFEKFYSLNGGLAAWQEAHLPLSKK